MHGTERPPFEPLSGRLILANPKVGTTLAVVIPRSLPSGDAHAKCPLHQARLATPRISRCAPDAAIIYPFGSFALALPNGPAQTPGNHAGRLPSASTGPCCSPSAFSMPEGGGTTTGLRCPCARWGRQMTLVSCSPAGSMPIPRRSSSAAPIASACSTSPGSRRSAPRTSSCSALRQGEALFGQNPGVLQSNLRSVDVVAADVVWCLSPTESPGDVGSCPIGWSDSSARPAVRSSVTAAIDGAIARQLGIEGADHQHRRRGDFRFRQCVIGAPDRSH
ncbi:hypothetical protein ABIB82_006683 [Bradyrhizobium sp. i1.8.4]